MQPSKRSLTDRMSPVDICCAVLLACLAGGSIGAGILLAFNGHSPAGALAVVAGLAIGYITIEELRDL